MTTKLTLIPAIKAFGEAIDALAELPIKPSEIAARLAADGIQGIRRTSSAGPIHAYIKAKVKLPEKLTLYVNTGGFEMVWGDTRHRWVFPTWLIQFAMNFDAGEYPELIGPSDPKAQVKSAL